MNESEKKALIEALVFAAADPVSPKKITDLADEITKAEAVRLLEELRLNCEGEDRGIMVRAVAGGFQMVSKPELAPWVRDLNQDRRTARLSKAALEVLAITSYRQPITLPEISEIRGTSSEGPVKTLLSRKMIRILGRKDVVGRPMIYGTTKEFLLHFGLENIADLPDMEEFEEFIQRDNGEPLKSQPDLAEMPDEEAGEADGE